jgi:hypothetical protein
MTTVQTITLFLFLFGSLCGFIAIGLLFYIGKTRIKEIDKAVLGYEFPDDSIFALIIRVPNYAGGFMWQWSARRTGLEGKIEHFDKRFRWPFIAAMVLVITSMSSMIIGTFMDKFL